MHKLLSACSCFLLLLLLGCQGTNLKPNEYRISQGRVQQAINRALPYGNSFDLVVAKPEIKVDKLRVILGGDPPGRVGIDGGMGISGMPQMPRLDVNIALDGVPQFVPEEGAIYLRDVQLRSVELEGNTEFESVFEQLLVGPALPLVSRVAGSYFDRYPIYRLSDDNVGESVFSRFGPYVEVENRDLVLRIPQ